MKAVILAAGIASRLRPLTNHCPKCLLKVGNKTILEHTLDNILANGLQEIVIVTGYLELQIRDFISVRYPRLSVTYIYNEKYSTTNNIYSLWLAKEWVLGDEMLLMDSDIIFDQAILTRLLGSGHDNCLALKRHAVKEEEIKIKAGIDGRVTGIGKEILLEEAIGESIGIEKFGKDTLYKLFEIIDHKIITGKKVNQFYEAAFQELADQGSAIYSVDVTDLKCMEIDTAEDLEEAIKFI